MEPMQSASAPAGPKFRPQKLIYFLRKFWWIPLITLALSTATAVVIFFMTPPNFVSYGSMWETEKLRLPDGAAFTEDRDNYLGTQTDVLRSGMLREMTLNRLKNVGTNEITKDKDGNPIEVDINVYGSPKSSVYNVEARSANPAFTPLYLNALMKQYLEYRKNIRREVSGDTLASISEQVQRLERDMKAGQAALNEYQKSNNFAVLVQESTIEASYLAKLKTELSDYQLQMKLLEARELEMSSGRMGMTNSSDTIFDSLRGSGAAVSSTTGRLDANRQIELLKLERDRLAKYLKPQHPKIVKLDEDISRAEKLVEVYRQQNQDQIGAARKALQIKVDSVEEFIRGWEGKLADSSARIAQADELKQNVQRNQGLYDRLSALLQNVDISRNIDQDTLAILEFASPSTRSYKEAKTMMSQSVILGLGLGLGIVALIMWRDDRFNSMVEVTEKFGDSVVGQVPELPEYSQNGQMPIALLGENDDRHMFAESYRNLRSALLYLAVDGKRPRVLLITSAVPNEGKSTVATNLARTMALGGSKVLLIDADLRKGHIHERLKLNAKPGLSELLKQPEQLAQLIQATDLPNFSFLSRGSYSRHPGDLFLSPAFDHILAQARAGYDYVIIDCSPVFAADDSSTLAPKADGTLFVVRSRFSHAREVREALELLFQRQARVLGLVLNRADATSRSYYAYKYAEYYSTANDEEIAAEKGS
jgi:capsular exopolysaccharide synthesis family protein